MPRMPEQGSKRRHLLRPHHPTNSLLTQASSIPAPTVRLGNANSTAPTRAFVRLVWQANASRVAGPQGLLRSQGQGACFQQNFEANSAGQERIRCGPLFPAELNRLARSGQRSQSMEPASQTQPHKNQLAIHPAKGTQEVCLQTPLFQAVRDLVNRERRLQRRVCR